MIEQAFDPFSFTASRKPIGLVIFLVITICCILGYYLIEMNGFEKINSTVDTGFNSGI